MKHLLEHFQPPRGRNRLTKHGPVVQSPIGVIPTDISIQQFSESDLDYTAR